MPVRSRIIGPLAMTLLVVAPLAAADKPSSLEFFEKKVRPIFVTHCYNCHSAETKPSGGLRVDDRNGLLIGGNTGAAVVPGKPEESLLLRRITQKEEKKRMPLEGKSLSEEQVADLRTWIKDGAAWPAVRVPVSLGKPKPEYEELKKKHWAWQPLTDPKVPAVKDAGWARDDIDRFLLARLEAKALTPVNDSDSLALIRRVTFDLTGLPPTPAEIDAFLKDRSPDAFERLVDRLLVSPAFGERWGRHWLDVARYGESTGPSRNIPYPHAWRYRDYVIASINADKPYDQFIREQIAGDLLPAKTERERDEMLTATGFLALGVKDVNQRFKVRFLMDNVDEQIDVVSRSILALTVSCARCHDHKFDPIPTSDYYALAGIFTSTDNCAGVRNRMGGGGLDYFDPGMLMRLTTKVPPPPADQVEKLKEQVALAKKEWDAIRGTPEGMTKEANGQPKQRQFQLKYDRLQGELLVLTDASTRGYPVHGVREAKTIGDTEIRIRGEAEKLGPVVPRGFLTAFRVPDAPAINTAQSGRLQLAEWLTSPKNPLPSRAMVNRVWQRLFGAGLVQTVDNFGVMGDTPSHPDLLDHLANRFMHDGWSLKKLVRTIVQTRAYRLGTETSEQHLSIDPGNRLLWRHTPRRLDAEEIRDAFLSATGTLDRNPPPGSPTDDLKMVEMRDDGPESRTIGQTADTSMYRSIYLPLIRGVTPRALEAFDPVDQTLVTGTRDATTVPGQALYMLNSPFVRQQSLALAERLLAAKNDDSQRIETAYRLTLGRSATEKEIGRTKRFLAEYESAYREQSPAPKQSKKPPAKKPKAGEPNVDEVVQPKDGRTAAWMGFVQALFASAEFRYLR